MTYSGDTAQVQLMRLVQVTGSEGAKTVVNLPGDATNGLLVDASRLGDVLINTGLFTPATAFGAGNAPGTAVDTPLHCDPDGNLATRGPVLTDEGSFRDDFPGSGLTTAFGSNPTFTNGSATVTIASGFLTSVRPGQYVKADAHAETAWALVESVDSDTSLTLAGAYTGATVTGAASYTNFETATTGSGTSVTVDSSRVNVATGTTSGDARYLSRLADFGPQIAQFLQLNVSQRIANQELGFGLRDSVTSPTHRAEVLLDGTTNTTVKFVTCGNDSATPTTTTVTLPGGATTATNADWRIEAMRDRCSLTYNGVVVATHNLHIPDPYREMKIVFYGRNTGTAGSTTTLSCDTIALANDNQLVINAPYLGGPLPVGATAVAHGTAPVAVAAGAPAVPLANRHGVLFTVGGHPNVVSYTHSAITTAVTDSQLVAVASGQRMVVTAITVTLDNASTVFPSVRIGFGTSTVPALGNAGIVLAHGGLPAGGGVNRGDGSGILAIGGDDQDLRVTTVGNATGNGVQITVAYYLVEG